MGKIHELINNGTIPVATGVFRGSDDIVNSMVEDYVFGATGTDVFSEYKLLFGTVIPNWKVSIIDKHENEKEPHYRILLKKGHGLQHSLDFVADYCDYRSDLHRDPAQVDREEWEGDGIHQELGQFLVSVWLPITFSEAQCLLLARNIANAYRRAMKEAFRNYSVLVYHTEHTFHE